MTLPPSSNSICPHGTKTAASAGSGWRRWCAKKSIDAMQISSVLHKIEIISSVGMIQFIILDSIFLNEHTKSLTLQSTVLSLQGSEKTSVSQICQNKRDENQRRDRNNQLHFRKTPIWERSHHWSIWICTSGILSCLLMGRFYVHRFWNRLLHPHNVHFPLRLSESKTAVVQFDLVKIRCYPNAVVMNEIQRRSLCPLRVSVHTPYCW